MKNQAKTSIEIFSIVQDLRMFATLTLKGHMHNPEDYLRENGITIEKLEKLMDFYISMDWEIF